MAKYQLVLQWPNTDRTDFDHLIYFENTLYDRLSRRLGKVDGHDIGSGEMNIFIFTDKPEKAFEECRSLIRSSRLVSGLSSFVPVNRHPFRQCHDPSPMRYESDAQSNPGQGSDTKVRISGCSGARLATNNLGP